MIPVALPDVGEEEVAAVAEVLRSGRLASGERVKELEARWAAIVGVRHAIAVSNGTVAAMCIYAGLGLGPGDEVITPSHTFNATISSIMSTGAAPVFVDIESTTFLIDPTLIEAAITPRTKAISPVHLFGLPADMPVINEIAARHGLEVVEDACQAHGARVGGWSVGQFGHAAFSLYATKNMTTGEGGLITTNDDQLAEWTRMYLNQGMRERYRHEILGFNFRMTDIAAAIGLCQLDKLERNTERRREIAGAYDRALASLPVRRQKIPEHRTHVFHQYTIDVGPGRDEIVQGMKDRGVDVGIYYPIPVHRQPYLSALDVPDLPVTDAVAATTLSLPMYPQLTPTDIATVVAALEAALSVRVLA